MPVGISACFVTDELDMSACTTPEGGGSIEQCNIGLVATEVRLIGTRGGGVANVGVPAKEVAGGTIPIVRIPNGEKEIGVGVMKIGNCSSAGTTAGTSGAACGILINWAGYYCPVASTRRG